MKKLLFLNLASTKHAPLNGATLPPFRLAAGAWGISREAESKGSSGDDPGERIAMCARVCSCGSLGQPSAERMGLSK